MVKDTTQSCFNVTKTIVRKDEGKKWDKLKKQLLFLKRMYDEDRVMNDISNRAIVEKILAKMEKYEDKYG